MPIYSLFKDYNSLLTLKINRAKLLLRSKDMKTTLFKISVLILAIVGLTTCIYYAAHLVNAIFQDGFGQIIGNLNWGF